jgi:branched-chain amino acid transport system substrate-binding protein
MANDIQQGKILGEFAAKQGAKTVAIIDDRSAYGQGLADEFKKAAEASGLKVVATEYTNDKATDFKAILTKIKSKKPDLVFYGGMDAQGGPLAKQMKELGLKAKFLGGDGVCTPEFMKLGGPATDGHYCSMPGVPLEKMAKGPDFKDKFTKKYNTEIQLYAPNVYDAVMVMADSMKRANSVEPAKYLPEVGKTSYEGVTAKIAFDEKGDLKGGAISLYQFKAGKLEYVETLGGGVAEAVADAAKATGDAAKAVGSAAVDMAKEGTKAATEMVKDAADATKAAADATKAAVEKK